MTANAPRNQASRSDAVCTNHTTRSYTTRGRDEDANGQQVRALSQPKRIQATRSGQSAEESVAAVGVPEGLVFAYVDNSNLWIEGGRLQAVKFGYATNPRAATQHGIQAPWSYDFGHLYQLVCPDGAKVGRSFLVGSRPPSNESVWERARDEGFEVEVFDRNAANKEKQVDSKIATTMSDDSHQHMNADRGDVAVLVAGDSDYLPSIRSLQKRGLRTRVVFWRYATSRELRDAADEFVELDHHFDWLTHPRGRRARTA